MRTRLPLALRRRPVTDLSEADLYSNPYPAYRMLRTDLPVAYAPALRHLASQPDAYWLVTRWDDVVAVLKDDELFRSPHEPPDLPPTLRVSLLYTDGAEHARIRASMQPACQPRRATAFADTVVLAAVDAQLDALESAGEAELVDAFFEPFAAATVARLLGLEGVPTDDLRRWFDHLGRYFTGESMPGPERRINDEIDEALRQNLARLVGQPDESVLATMSSWHDESGGLTAQQTLSNAKMFAAAGMHELSDLLAHALLGLLSRPEQLAEVREEPGLARRALEEAARWGSPVGMVPRRTEAAVELSGVRVPRGAMIAAVIASANRDESRFGDANAFDLHRDEGMHLAFASGVHFCLGAWIVRAAGAIVLARLVERLPRLRLREGDPLVVTGWRFRDVRRLWAAWT